MKYLTSNIFDFSGFAALNDLNSMEWEALFSILEQEQAVFSSNEEMFRSIEYKWPRKPLHTWSRLWEYPYVYQHIKNICNKSNLDNINILDYGCGVTFFPFSIARLGSCVTCVDIDPVCARDLVQAANIVQHSPGQISVALIKDNTIPIESFSQDMVYCISVLEHVPNLSIAIDEMVRVLKPGGHLILTVDIDLRGNFELGSIQFRHLQSCLKQYFYKYLPERAVHPADLLTTANSPYNMKIKSLFFPIKQIVRDMLRCRLTVGNPQVSQLLTVYGCALVKK